MRKLVIGIRSKLTMTRPNQQWPPKYRPDLGAYSVAFSFAGEQAELVRAMAEKVEAALLPGEVFFDEYFEQKIVGAKLREELSDVYLKRSVLVVRCLSLDYRDKPWTQAESTVIALRKDCVSVLDIQVTDTAIDGLAGKISFCPKAHLDLDSTVQIILARLRDLTNVLSKNIEETRQRISAYRVLDLCQKIGLAKIEPARLRIAVHATKMVWPAPHEIEFDTIRWWLNIARSYESNTQLIKLLQGLWTELAPFEAEINNWFLTYCGEPFPVPQVQALQHTPVIQITRELCKGRKDSPKSRIFFDLCHGDARSQISQIEADEAELTLQFAAHFDNAQSHIDGGEMRVELVLELDQLHGAMQRQQVRYGNTFDALHLTHPTVIRHLNRKDFRACCAQVWHAQLEQNLSHCCCSPPFARRWEQMLDPKSPLVFFSIESALEVQPNFFNALVMARAPIAIWFSGTEGSAWPPLNDAEIKQILCSRSNLPRALLNLRNALKPTFPDIDITVLFEDAAVPVRRKSEFTQLELENPS
jgi:hypothetical protein